MEGGFCSGRGLRLPACRIAVWSLVMAYHCFPMPISVCGASWCGLRRRLVMRAGQDCCPPPRRVWCCGLMLHVLFAESRRALFMAAVRVLQRVPCPGRACTSWCSAKGGSGSVKRGLGVGIALSLLPGRWVAVAALQAT